MSPIAPRMDDALGDAFMVKMKDLFAEMLVFHQRRPACAGPQRVLVVSNRRALCRGQDVHALFGGLVKFPAVAPGEGLVMDPRGLCGWMLLAHRFSPLAGLKEVCRSHCCGKAASVEGGMPAP